MGEETKFHSKALVTANKKAKKYVDSFHHEMPEEIWVWSRRTKSSIKGEGGYWSEDGNHVDTKYRLKSSEDKTIRELAAAVCQKMKEHHLMASSSETPDEKKYHAIQAGLLKIILDDNTPRIAEAQQTTQGDKG